MTCASSSGEAMPYFANTAGAAATMPARSPGILASEPGHRRDSASPNDDSDMAGFPDEKAARKAAVLMAEPVMDAGGKGAFARLHSPRLRMLYGRQPGTWIANLHRNSGDA